MSDASSEVSQLLDAWSDGDSKALDRLMPLVYDELRRIAARHFKNEPADHTLQPTALVNELFIRFKGQRKVKWHSRAELFSVASKLIRRILVDHARRRLASKRGGDTIKVPLDEVQVPLAARDPDLVALDEALKRLAKLDSRASRIVELRIFGGLDFKVIAELEKIGRATVWRDWKSAQLWLRRELGPRAARA